MVVNPNWEFGKIKNHNENTLTSIFFHSNYKCSLSVELFFLYFYISLTVYQI